MVKTLARRSAMLLLLILMTIVAACGGESDRSADSSGGASVPRSTVISETIFQGDLGGVVTVPGQGNIAAAVKDAAVPAIHLSSTGSKRDPVGDGNGGIFRLTPALSGMLNGRKVTVSISLRMAPQNGSPSVKAMYSRPGAASSSGWHDLTAGPEFATASFEYKVPARAEEHGPDLVSIWADPEAKGRGVEIQSIRIDSAAQ